MGRIIKNLPGRDGGDVGLAVAVVDDPALQELEIIVNLV